MTDNSVPSGPVVSCHLERPRHDDCWRRFDALRRRFEIIALIRPPDAAFGEDEQRWLERARTLELVGLHTHWTSPSHARPTGGDPAARGRSEGEWMRANGIEPRWFCGGGWYSDDEVAATVQQLGLVDCTPRGGAPAPGVLPTTNSLGQLAPAGFPPTTPSLGQLARAVLRPLPAYVHAYFHDYDLLVPSRRLALRAAVG